MIHYTPEERASMSAIRMGCTFALWQFMAQWCIDAEVSLRDLRGPARHAPIVRARRAFMLAARQRGFTLTDIGRAARRDQSTVMHNLRKATCQ